MEKSGDHPSHIRQKSPSATVLSSDAQGFLAIKTRKDLAAFFGLSYRTFTYLLYRKPPEDRYTTFSIRKKNGAERLIEAPIRPIRIMQRRVADLLMELYKPRKCVQGFVHDAGIVSNAGMHVGRRWMLNLDLKDFFHSVHFGRVKGLFKTWRFQFTDEVATTLAHLCCHNKRLPQGAPSSPVISNLICDPLDGALTKYARNHGCRYSRYSDDMTFSTTRRELPEGLATLHKGERPSVSTGLLSTIEANRFSLNTDKVRVRHRTERQEVTGLTVNVRANVKRQLVRQIRAMLHAWQKHGYDLAQAEFYAKWDKKDRRPKPAKPLYRDVLRGRIEFLGAVRGSRDPLYVKYLRQYCALDPTMRSKVLAMINAEERDVFLCHASEDKEQVVLPLADAFERGGLTCFLDANEILWGDSVTNVINRALVSARFVLVVISERSLEKHWPQKEMNAALAHEISTGVTRVLPLLVGKDDASREKLWRQLALQSDKRYLPWTGDTQPVVDELKRLLERSRPTQVCS